MKFSSDRLRTRNNDITITLDEARLNNEIVSIADNETLRQYRKARNIFYSYKTTRDLISLKKKLSRENNNKETRNKIREVQRQIDETLFVSEIVFVQFANISHYKKIDKEGLFINGKKYVRLLCGAGHARKSIVMFVVEELFETLKKSFDNGRDLEKELVAGKLGAYEGLYASSTQIVSQPRFVVVADLETEQDRLVDWVFENESGEEDVIEKNISLKSNLFDGQGLVSMGFAETWARDLGLDYTPSSFCVRSSYLKGQCVSFDFHEMAKENGIKKIKDVYGNEYDIKDIDAIIAASQFKLWSSYSSMEQYLESSKKNGIKWGVSKYTPKTEKNFFWSSYQYVQVLNLNEKEVEELCKPTIDYIKSVSSEDANSAIIYMLGNKTEKDLEKFNIDEVDDKILKVLLFNKGAIKDTYIRNYLLKKLNKKIRESYTGKLLLNGNYQVAVSDPYALSQHSLGLKVTGLLGENEYYCSYWNDRGVNKVSALRSPLTWRSEVNKLSLKKGKRLDKWFGHIKSGVIYNIFGIDTFLQADSDFDYDIIATTDNTLFFEKSYGGLPITYERKNAPKKKINKSDIYEADILSFGSKIGLVTNYSTSMYSLISKFKEGSEEYETLLKRLKICRFLQGQQIDRTKGVITKPVPEWSKWKRVEKDSTEEEKRKIELHNKLLIDKRPMFMRYLYAQKNKEHKDYHDNWENYCQTEFGYGVDELLKKERDAIEETSFQRYVKFNPFIYGSTGVMDMVYLYMIKSISEQKISFKNSEFDYSTYMDKDIRSEKSKLEQMKELFREYKAFKKNLYSSSNFDNADQMLSIIRHRAEFGISSNIKELANLAIMVSYSTKTPSAFAFDLFFDGVVENMKKNFSGTIEIPVITEEENFSYLGKKYKIKKLKVKNA